MFMHSPIFIICTIISIHFIVKNLIKMFTNLILELLSIRVCFTGEQSEVSWLLSVLRETESDIRDGEEQLLLFWLLLCVTSSDKESVSFASSETKTKYLRAIINSLRIYGKLLYWFHVQGDSR